MEEPTTFLDELLASFTTVEIYIKLGILLVTAPFWFPILRALWEEIQKSLAPDGGFMGNREPTDVPRRAAGEDPWLNVPLAAYRQQRQRARSTVAQDPRRGSGPRSAPPRRTGF